MTISSEDSGRVSSRTRELEIGRCECLHLMVRTQVFSRPVDGA